MKDIFLKQRNGFRSLEKIASRKKIIKHILEITQKNQKKIVEAAYADMQRPDVETFMMEYGPILEEAKFALKNIEVWTKQKKVKTPLLFFKASSLITPQPIGNVLIMSAWNFPFFQTLVPAIGAFAAGNSVTLKPSPESPACAELLKQIVNSEFDTSVFHCFTGDNDVSNQLLDLPFNKIFFTGSPRVAKHVMTQAAKNLTPVVLELGGKSPAIVDSDARIELAAKRIMWGKFFNCGQICVAPDYAYVHEKVKDKFVSACIHAIQSFYGQNPLEHPDYGRIINQRNYDRLKSYLAGVNILHGGAFDDKRLKISPTIVESNDLEHPLQKEEVFGPIFLIKTFNDMNSVLGELRNGHPPLALYYFTENKISQQKVIAESISGGVTINDTMMHGGNINLPFGGIGQSGMGAYHGKFTFDTFTHFKSTMNRSNCIDVPMRYPPFERKFEKLLKMSRWM